MGCLFCQEFALLSHAPCRCRRMTQMTQMTQNRLRTAIFLMPDDPDEAGLAQPGGEFVSTGRSKAGSEPLELAGQGPAPPLRSGAGLSGRRCVFRELLE